MSCEQIVKVSIWNNNNTKDNNNNNMTYPSSTESTNNLSIHELPFLAL